MTQLNPMAWWRGKFGTMAPIGYELREQWDARWSRFHSLPDSKRYPDTPAEYTELLRRARALANAVFVGGEMIFVFHSIYAFDDAPPAIPTELADFLSPTRSKFDVENGEAACYTRAFDARWPLATFDALVAHIADERISMLSIVAPESGNVLCPYDGGFDLFTHAPTAESLRETFPDWLSARPDYL